MDTKAKSNNNGGANNPRKQKDSDRQRQWGQRNSLNTQGLTPSSRFQGQDQTEMKGIVIDHSLDHKTPISQQFNTFCKAAKIASGNMNPNLGKPMPTLKGLTEENFTIAFPDAEKWTNNGVVDLHKKELYSRLWVKEQKGIKKRAKQYEEDLMKMLDIMHGQLSSGITEKLKAKDDWTAVEEQANTLKLLEYLKEICYRDNESSICPPVDVLMKMKKFLTAFHGASKDPTKYIVSEELTRYTMKRVFPDKKYSDYAGMTEADKKPIIETAEQILLSVQIIEGSNCKNHRNLQGLLLKDEYCLKKDAYPINTSNTLDMLLRFKTTKSNNQKQHNNSKSGNNSKGTQPNGNGKQGSEKTFEGTAFLTHGETINEAVQEAHQLFMNGILKDSDSTGIIDKDDSLSDSGGVPLLVPQQTNGESDSEGSIDSGTDGDESNDKWSIESSQYTRSEKPRSEISRSEKPMSGESGCQAEATISNSIEFLLVQNHRKLDLNLLLLDSQASCNVSSNKALLRNIWPHPNNG
eukprot:jgi/Psemu1/24059/gm1.24059_g